MCTTNQCQRLALSSTSVCKQIFFSWGISLLDLTCGVAFAHSGIILPRVTDPKSDDDFYMNTEQASLYTSMLFMGCLIGSLICGPLAIRFGQRTTIAMSIPLSLFGWLVSYLSHSFWLQLTSRFVIGIYASLASGCSTTYIAETVHSSLRGPALAFTDLSRQCGILFTFLVGSTSLHWRNLSLICGLAPLTVPCAIVLSVPHSPRWLAIVSRPESEVKGSLIFFRGKMCDVQSELDQIQEDVSAAQKRASAFDQLKIMVRDKPIRKLMAFLMYLNIGMNFAGAAVLVNYTASVFQLANTGISPYLSSIICGAVRVVTCFLYMFIADRLGRRPISIAFQFLAGVALACLGLYFYLMHHGYDISAISWLPLTSFLLCHVSTCVYVTVIRSVRSELLPNIVRGLGVNLCTFNTFFGGFLVTLSYPLMAEYLGGHWTFWVYSFNVVSMSIICYIFLPETKGKSLEEIAKRFK